MELKYRIKKFIFETMPDIYIAQYRILGIWLNIKYNLSGTLFTNKYTFNDTVYKANDLIKKHKQVMKTSGEWWTKKTYYIHEKILKNL